ncbi:MAG: hypothetical protein M3017_03810 [Actinomycetota bacterium]|nr:hypothetical protein [Actinomycetota bacterium]
MSHTKAVTPADTQVPGPGPDTASAAAEVPAVAEVPATETLDAVGPAGFPYDEAEYDEAGDLPDESFIPRARYRVGRSTKVLACVLLVVLGAFGGALTQKAVDGGSARSTRGSQFSTSGLGGATNGAGTGTGAGQGRRTGQPGTGSGGSGGAGTGSSGGATGGAG